MRRARRLSLGLATLLGYRRGWFLPYRYAASLPGPDERRPYDFVAALLREREAAFAEVLAMIAALAPALMKIGDDLSPAPRWRQDWFPRLDAAAAYALVRQQRPSRITEVGSGHSTRFLARALADGAIACRLTAVDPAPRAALSGLDLTLIRCPLHQAGDAPFADLAADDMLIVDSSHLLMPGSDVDQLFGRILPALTPGVRVHFHDIFLPDDYPPSWAWRGYNEQLALLALLQGGAWRVDFASHYAATRMAKAVAGSLPAGLPLLPGAFESSFWLTKMRG